MNNHIDVSPRSGTEPDWTPEKWYINEKYNNCYSYALNDHDNKRQQKAIPGTSANFYTCSKLMEGLKHDYPKMYVSSFEAACENGYRKIYAATSDPDDNGNNDFHFWRQDADGFWSHKPGSDHPSRVDGNYEMIQNPDLSNRMFANRAYVNGCGFFCINH
jgi:hypothetical protein